MSYLTKLLALTRQAEADVVNIVSAVEYIVLFKINRYSELLTPDGKELMDIEQIPEFTYLNKSGEYVGVASIQSIATRTTDDRQTQIVVTGILNGEKVTYLLEELSPTEITTLADFLITKKEKLK